VDVNTWIELDCRTNQQELVGINKSSTFSASGNEYVRQIRLRQHGKNSSNRDYLTVGAFELFGTVRGLDE
jgi:hypothetical protein